MTNQITKRQHQVPQFYIKLWADSSNQIYLYDLQNQNYRFTGSKNILFDKFFYEEDPAIPDNRIENILGKIEAASAPILKELNQTINKYPNYSQDKQLKKELKDLLGPDNQQIIKDFSAFQYLRIPGAIEQKEYELQGSSMQKVEIDYGLNPGRFVESGFDYLKERFGALKMLVNYSYGETFLTSDWPCFDMKDSDDAPLLAEELGVSKDVFVCITLGPKLSVIFYPHNFRSNPRPINPPDLIIKSTPDSQVKNHNTLIIQQAIRYVISNKQADFIYKIASKRKRNKF
jgi:hypothetical protein